ncbi:hypothetical protein SLI_0197 [Streptomyces lividans 1326]|uniref:Uncharacterized protein n=1 Tax=Streptomyces lividans 1326 TaxID=1200984 RepID=A0A7U9DNM3_STRLI|nr:hypothetical protein SLI_0197 [Streptomyces lividans 1326]
MPPTCPKRRRGTDGAPHIVAGGHRRRKDARSVGPVTIPIPVRVDDGRAGTDEAPPGPRSWRTTRRARARAARPGVRRGEVRLVPAEFDGSAPPWSRRGRTAGVPVSSAVPSCRHGRTDPASVVAWA